MAFETITPPILTGLIFATGVKAPVLPTWISIFIISEIESIEWENKGVNFKSSSWINLYNLHVINKIAKKYPIASVTDLPNFFDEQFIELNGKKISLNELESEIRFNANDARIHFALVCGAKSCPPLFNKAFTEENFNSQLDFISKFALKKEHVIKSVEESNTLYLNQIFNWYAEEDLPRVEKLQSAFVDTSAPKNGSGFYGVTWYG